jgi:hypothetical protein
MVKGYELRMTGLLLFMLAPVSLFHPSIYSLGIPFLLMALAMIFTALGLAQKSHAEMNGGANQFMPAVIPLSLFIVTYAVCLTWLF